jgi:hypothetical protein
VKREPRSLRDLEPEFRRAGVDPAEAFRELVNRNLPPGETKVAPGESVNIAVSVDDTERVLASLPNAAGTSAFVEAMITSLQSRLLPRRGSSGAAGA